MKILVTGCMGFIGSNLVPFLLKDGHEVIGFDNRSNSSLDPTGRMKKKSGDTWSKFKYYDVDIRNFQQMISICANEVPDVIIHLAALGSVPRSFTFPAEVIAVNEVGFCNVLMLADNMRCQKMVYASSSSVYGTSPERVKMEGREGFPLSPYALTKKQNEQMAMIWSQVSALKTLGLRFFNVYGPGQLPNSPYSAVIPKFINDECIIIHGDGKTVRDFTYVDDVCEAIVLAIQDTEKSVGICNIGTGNPTEINALAFLIGRGQKEVKRGPARAGESKYSIASTDFAKEKIGWTAKTELTAGLKKTMEFYENQLRP